MAIGKGEEGEEIISEEKRRVSIAEQMIVIDDTTLHVAS